MLYLVYRWAKKATGKHRLLLGCFCTVITLSRCLQGLSEAGAMCEDTCHPHEFQHPAPMHEVKEIFYHLAWAGSGPVGRILLSICKSWTGNAVVPLSQWAVECALLTTTCSWCPFHTPAPLCSSQGSIARLRHAPSGVCNSWVPMSWPHSAFSLLPQELCKSRNTGSGINASDLFA